MATHNFYIFTNFTVFPQGVELFFEHNKQIPPSQPQVQELVYLIKHLPRLMIFTYNDKSIKTNWHF